MPMGCTTQPAGEGHHVFARADVSRLGCRLADRVGKAYVAENSDPAAFAHAGRIYLARANQTTENTVTAWWDASQLYGYDTTSRRRVKRDPHDPAKLLLILLSRHGFTGDAQGYLPTFDVSDPIARQWAGQEATAFP